MNCDPGTAGETVWKLPRSWKLIESDGASDLVLSIAASEQSSAESVRSIAGRVALIEALGSEPLSARTIAHGSLDLARIFDLVSDPGTPELAWAAPRQQGTLDWRVTLEGDVLRAELTARVAPDQPLDRTGPTLGADE